MYIEYCIIIEIFGKENEKPYVSEASVYSGK